MNNRVIKGVAYILGRTFSGNCLADLTQRVSICELELAILLKGENGSLRRVKGRSFVLEVVKLSTLSDLKIQAGVNRADDTVKFCDEN